ncbi:MAG: response regulator [Chloroflexota bacterium]
MSMLSTEWHVLLVDDEPDVIQVSKLVMADFKVYGQPVRLHVAQSQAEAIELLSSNDMFSSTLAVAFIDIVMESDTAGLELCQYIRETMKNDTTQIFIRTGQPGVASERDVIDRYDINGYFTKTEATEDKLYSLVKSGVRQYLSTWNLHGMLTMLDAFITAGDKRQNLEETLKFLVRGLTVTNQTETDAATTYVLINGESIIDDITIDREEAMQLKDSLAKFPSQPLGADGDHYMMDEQNNIIINIVSKPYQPESFLLIKGAPFATPNSIVNLLYMPIKSLATLWSRAA